MDKRDPKNHLRARSRTPLSEDGVRWWETYGSSHSQPSLYSDENFDEFSRRKLSKSQSEISDTDLILEEHVLRPSELRREIKLAKLRAIGSVFEELALHSFSKSETNLHKRTKKVIPKQSRESAIGSGQRYPNIQLRSQNIPKIRINSDDYLDTSKSEENLSENGCRDLTKSRSEGNLKANSRIFMTNKLNATDSGKNLWHENTYRVYKTSSDGSLTSFMTAEKNVDEEHTIRPSLVKIRSKIARILGKERDEELLWKLSRCRHPSDTRWIACRNAIRESHESIGRTKPHSSISWAETFTDAERRPKIAIAEDRSWGASEHNMPRLPSTRKDTLSAPRSARGPPSTSTVARRPTTISGSSTLPRRTKFIEKPPPSPSPQSMDSQGSGGSELRRQNDELRTRLAVESAEHRRRLEAYKRAQQGQAALVSRLQSKVLQYRERCAELESQILHTPRPETFLPIPTPSKSYKAIALPGAASIPPSGSGVELQKREERIDDLETALRRLEEERRKCEKLLDQNNTLRDQLEESQQINEALTNDLQKLTNDWEALREEIIIKEDEWKDEEQAFNEYYTTEHNRLLTLWREVISVKRHFSELQSTTERELVKFRGDVDSSVRDLLETYSRFNMNALTSGKGLKIDQQSTTNPDRHPEIITAKQLHGELRETVAQRDKAINDLRERDGRIQKLLHELQTLEERCESLEKSSEEAILLRSALEEVARALIADSGSQPLSNAERSPKRVRPHTPNSTGFAESTISAVHAALHKYQLHIHELQVKLQNSKEQLISCKKHCESVDANNNTLENKVLSLQGNLDEAVAEINQLQQEKESLQKTVEILRSEKYNLDRNRLEINSMVESLSSDYEKLQKVNTKLERTIETLEAEKRDLRDDIDRLQREVCAKETGLRCEEDKNTRIRTELAKLREDLNAAQLANQLLKQHKAESDSLVLQLEKHRADLEIELEHVVVERADLQDVVEKLQNNIDALQQDRKRLMEQTKQLEEEKSSLANQSSDQSSDMNTLKKELLAAEQHRLELENDRASLLEKIKLLECEKEKVETDLGQVVRDRSELSSQLTAIGRKKDALNEEIMRLQQRLEQCTETNARLNRSLEEYVKETEEKQIQIDTAEKERHHLQEQLCAILTEKDALETALFDANNILEGAEGKCKQLESQLQTSLITQEKLKGQICRLTKELEASDKKLREQKSSLGQQSSKKEAEYQHLISNLNRTAAENISKVNEEKEHLRQTLEQKLSSTIMTLTAEKEALEANMREKEKKWRTNRESLVTQHDEAMLRAENEKQQALLMAQHDLQALTERLEEAKNNLEAEQHNQERLKREAQARYEQDRAIINQLKDELAACKMKLDEAKGIAEDDVARYENRIKELQLERENCQREMLELKGQLQVSEDKGDNANGQLNETLRKLKEVENDLESVRKELLESRRELQTRGIERDELIASCARLRDHVTRAEAEKRDANRATQEAYHKIAALEETKTCLETERTRLQTMLKESENAVERYQRESQTLEEQLKRERSSGDQVQNEMKELHARLSNESEERNRMSSEAGAARRRAAELEALLHAARTDLARHHRRAAELDQALKARDQELVLRLEDCRSKERRLEELKHNLEVCLADATQQIQELKARLGGCESRCRGLETQLANCEAERRDAQLRMSSVARSLRRVAGIQPDGSLQPPARLTSPARRYSPRRGREHSEERCELIEVDPELIKKGIRNLMHEVNQVEREKEDFKSQICSLRKQLKDATEQQGKGEGKLTSVQQNLRTAQDNASKLQNILAQRDSQIKTQNETIQSKAMEVNTLRDRIHTLETNITILSEEKGQCEVNADKIKTLMAERDAELNEARGALAEADGRASRLQLRLAHVTADLQRQTQRSSDLENACSKLKDQCEVHVRTISSLEERCSSLKTSIEQLTVSLQKAAASEAESRAEVARLQRHLSDCKLNEQNTAEKLRQCQKNLSAIENEKRVVIEKFESAKLQCAELKRANASLEDQVHRLNAQIANLEVQRSGLESRLRLTTTTYDAKDVCDCDVEREVRGLQREKEDYKAEMDRMRETIRKLETEIQIQKTAYRSRSHERLDRSLYCGDILDTTTSDLQIMRRKTGGGISPEFALLEVENRELRMKIRRLEKEVADKECEVGQMRARMLNERNVSPDRDTYRILEAREASHRQQVRALENQLSQLRAQLAGEVRRRQSYVSRSGRAARDVQRLRSALGDSLRTVSQEPSLDSYMLEHEARKLDNTLTHSLPPLNDSLDSIK